MLKTAKSFYRQGFAIHWLKEKSKLPVESKWTTGPRKNLKGLIGSYRKGFNIGTRLGEASQVNGKALCVIDCDVKSDNPDRLREMRKKLATILPEWKSAPIVLSGRGNGSMHVYCLINEPVRGYRVGQSKHKVKVKMPSVKASKNDVTELGGAQTAKGYRLRPAWEIGVMCEGQQVVLPPSLHPDTEKEYVWKNQFDLEKLPIFSAQEKESTTGETATLQDFDFVDVDLYDTELSAKTISLITRGDDCDDRSAALFIASRELVHVGLTDQQILSVLTDKENFLGQTGFDHAKTQSRKRAAKWVNGFTLAKVRRELSADTIFDGLTLEEPEALTNEEAQKQRSVLIDKSDWKKRIQKADDEGTPKANYFNIKLILTGVAGDSFVARNEFAVEDRWQRDCPWGSKKDEVVKDEDSVLIKDWLVHNYRLEAARERIEEVLIKVASDNAFHPVREFLEPLEWDGVERVGDWLVDYMGARGNPKYLHAVGRLTLMGMVSRIFEPGVKFDTVLILEGSQGIGKSTAARILAGDEWFSDTSLNIGDKDAVVNMQGVWINELGELSVLSRNDSNNLKEFISRSTDKIRPPYGKRTVAYPRQNIFIGTTNKDQYLKDDTGNRRFYPVKCGKIALKRLRADRDQLLAEAMHQYKEGYSLRSDSIKAERLAVDEQAHRMEHDEIESELEEFFAGAPDDFPMPFRIMDVMAHADLGVKKDRASQMRIANALRKIGYVKQQRRVQKVKGHWWQKSVAT